MLFSKKRYAGLLFTKPEACARRARRQQHHPSRMSAVHANAQGSGTVDVKGLQSVRRDSCELLRETLKECIDTLLCSGDVERAQSVAQRTIAQLLQRQVPLKKLILSKRLSKLNYKSKVCTAGRVLALLMTHPAGAARGAVQAYAATRQKHHAGSW
jgi:DNA polymerase elongation subunit (family B)